MERADRAGPARRDPRGRVGTHVAGPFAGQLLGDFGAEVIKIEQPDRRRPDARVGTGPPGGTQPVVADPGRNKKSVTLDLRQREGQAAGPAPDPRDGRRPPGELPSRHAGEVGPGPGGAAAASARPDRRPGQRLRPDRPVRPAGRLRQHRRGHGRDPPRHRRPGPAARPGRASASATPSPVSSPPTASRCRWCTGNATAVPVDRQRAARRPQGQVVDVAIYEAVLALMESLRPRLRARRPRPGAAPASSLPNVAPSNIYMAADGVWVLIAANADAPFRRLAEVMGEPRAGRRPALRHPHRPGRARGRARRAHRDWARRISTSDKLVEVLSEHGVPAERDLHRQGDADRPALRRPGHADRGRPPGARASSTCRRPARA